MHGAPLLQFSASHHRAEDLSAASHTHELRPREAGVLHLDALQRGLGTGSCGPDTLPAYRIAGGRHRFRYSMRALAPRAPRR